MDLRAERESNVSDQDADQPDQPVIFPRLLSPCQGHRTLANSTMGVLSTLALLVLHPVEFAILLRYRLFHGPTRDLAAPHEHPTSGWDRPSMRRCWQLLDMTSRSFSVVIKELEGDLARAVRIRVVVVVVVVVSLVSFFFAYRRFASSTSCCAVWTLSRTI